MSNITASMVKELRERTGAGMMECKKALVEAAGDIEAAITEMRKRGQAKAAKRAGKTAAEGIIVVKQNADNTVAFMAEVNSETDFVARDTSFNEFANKVAAEGLVNSVSDLAAMPAAIEEERMQLVNKIGENIQLRRVALLESTGTIGAYIHGGRIGVLVALDKNEQALAKDVAMHIAASNPASISEKDIPADLLERERDIFIDQAKQTGKPDNIIEKMVEGRIKKFIKESCLVGQPFVKNPDQTVAELLASKQAEVTAFVRFEVGEGIEKEVVDFAEEVKAQVQGSE